VIARETVVHVADLAELSLDDDEIDALTEDLAAIVAYVEQLSEVVTEGVSPLRAATGLAPWRADEPKPCLTHDEALAAAPRAVEGGFAVPTFVTRA
jgi:aspartyl-tRNA(Asn)/glutamyl-tRNA(Gln) amidotransferase subunit C